MLRLLWIQPHPFSWCSVYVCVTNHPLSVCESICILTCVSLSSSPSQAPNILSRSWSSLSLSSSAPWSNSSSDTWSIYTHTQKKQKISHDYKSHPHSRNDLNEERGGKKQNKTQKQLNLMPTSLPVTMTTVRRPLAGTLCCAITLWCLVCCAPLTRPGPLLPAQEPTQREEQSIFLMSAEKKTPLFSLEAHRSLLN